METRDKVAVSYDVEEIKRGLHDLDVIYGRKKAQVIINAKPIFVFNKEDNLFHAQYDKETEYLLEEISKQHCEAIKALAEKYGITIKDTNYKEELL